MTDTKTSLKSHITATSWIVFISGLLFYGYNYLLRVYPNTMKNQLFTHYGITATGFGLLASFYYFAYAPMQLPAGVSVDKIGPRRSLIAACAVCLIGVFIFAATNSYSAAIFGRFLIGIGTAFAYVTALKLASVWLPRQYFATATGAVTAFGMLAGVFTEKFATYLVLSHGYQYTIRFPLYVGIVVLVLLFLFIKDKPKKPINSSTEVDSTGESHALTYKQLRAYLKVIIKNKQMWLIGIIGALLYMPSTVFCDLWGIPYLQQVYHLSAQQAASGISIMLLGWLLSSLTTGALSDILGNRKMPLVLASIFAAIFAIVIFYVPGIDTTLLYLLLFFFGVSCGPHPLTFTLSKENNKQNIAGTAVAFANFIIMMGGFLFQPIVGKLLDLGWHNTLNHGIRSYTSHDYTLALTILPVALVLSFILSLFIKETYRR
ncbi:MAG: MFS transporter [Gammaproteobacteria bacterium]|nr:MFS transporter [Gammaproteobacteria bacterium]MCH9744714.1 MFS transporter [Gammaproteobacteria bacterium]